MMRIGVTDANLNLVSDTSWLCGFGFLVCEKQQSSDNNTIKLSISGYSPGMTPDSVASPVGVIPAHVTCRLGSLLFAVT